ncbi:diaminopimelate epimerase [Paraburkholderia sp. 31.1]|uniref:diaminopimelate epimerase n=1 Tax=unclassified Paraburkholderia TaxID=2615204 RepID=UPI0016565D4F|nr:diaminopimelate epimerase [Paraburkholderia sp. 31.1]MBC8724648.1 diaminopimelate epimerase [Paraburkholderia sp. 31.1]
MRNESFDFRKYDALGNDYLVVDPRHCGLRMTPETVRKLCDRHHGVGSDGIVLGPIVDGGRLGLRLFNADGSECEKSGNGLRIFARSLIDAGYVSASKFTVRLEYSGQDIDVDCLDCRDDLIKVAMGAYALHGPGLPVRADGCDFIDRPIRLRDTEVRASCVDMGNPHCVVIGEPVNEATARSFGREICSHPYFPNKTNVQFVEVIAHDRLRIEIWERGAGYTLASGSSSCAAVAACRELGLVDDRVTVEMPGGTVVVEIGSGRNVFLTGPVKCVAAGVLADDLKRGLTDAQR